MKRSEIKQFVEDNSDIVRMTQSEKYEELYVLKYKNNVFYDNLWHRSPILLDLRGTVIDKDFNPIIMPFRKIFNQYENKTNIDRDEEVLATQKVNGFMGAVTWNNGKVYFSTTGSLDSVFTDRIREMIPPKFLEFLHSKAPHEEPVTYLFEIVHPEDPHVIPEKIGAHMLGVRVPEWGYNHFFGGTKNFEEQLDYIAAVTDCLRPKWKTIRFSDLCKEVKECEHEGYVAYGSQTTLKLKSPYYKITKLFGRMKGTKLGNYFRNPESLRQTIDEEYYPLLDYLIEHEELFLAMTEQTKMKFIREYLS